MPLNVSPHPLVADKLAILRDRHTEPKKFRELVRELTWLLGYEATADLATRPFPIETPLGPMTAAHASSRASAWCRSCVRGWAWWTACSSCCPCRGLAPRPLPRRRDAHAGGVLQQAARRPTVQVCLVLDPMLATGGSAVAAIDILKKWGAAQIKLVALIAAPEGVATLGRAHPDVRDPCRGDRSETERAGYIVPGLGDAGDRQFGTFAGPSSKPGGAPGDETAAVVDASNAASTIPRPDRERPISDGSSLSASTQRTVGCQTVPCTARRNAPGLASAWNRWLGAGNCHR